ncbi:hypothetical protein RJT34_18426 [Clitoria ternatea]|uniref:Protein kinase domain-containing protein n=1 Tax=Clitoria ternatea TaxID=43366 RepID=A0AAN9PFT6_CLITE
MEPLSWQKRLEICIGAAHGLHYLHTGAKRSIFHCDIKPQNILLDDNMIPKLSHLGFSLLGPLYKSKPKPIQVDKVIGTFVYMAPEYVKTSIFTDKCDVYSFGMVLLEVACTNYKRTVFDKMNKLGWPYLGLEDSIYLMDPGNFLERCSFHDLIDPILVRKIAPKCLEVFINITKRCLKREPDERPTMGEVEVELEQCLALQEEVASFLLFGWTREAKKSKTGTMLLKCLGLSRSNHSSSSHPQRPYPTVIEELCHQFSVSDVMKSTNNFDENKIIGEGGFGKVYKGCLQHNDGSDYTVALKRLHSSRSGQRCNEFKNEIELLCQLRHPNLVTLIGFYDHKNEKIIVYDYMSNGSLDRHLQGGGLPWKKRLEICIGVARAVHYLHAGAKRTIIHRDLKPSNILLDHNMDPKLTDFGLSLQGPRYMSKPKPIQVDRITGTFDYMAMEYALYGIITDKSDVYSFGMVLLEVVCGREYIRGLYGEQSRVVEENIDPSIKGNIAAECWQVFIDITQRCLELEPDERPTMGEVEVQLEHALSMQEEADTTNAIDFYALFSTTIINLRGTQEGSITSIQSDNTEDSDSEDLGQ